MAVKNNDLAIDVSVIVSVYNQERFIGRCLRSLLDQQSFTGTYEIIIVDDCSDDLTPYALSQFGSAIKVIRNEQNVGLAESCNIGIRAASGRYVVRVDSDDFVNKHFLLMGQQFLETNLADTDAVALDYYTVDDEEAIMARYSAETFPIACAVFFQLKHILELGGYDSTFRFQEDVEFMLRFKKHYKISYLHVPLYRYRRHEDNITNDLQNMKKYKRLYEQKHGK